jgi:acyl-CoA synthetase (AMP-forming)/AMP-acid ligase II
MGKFDFTCFSELYKTCISQVKPDHIILIYKDNRVTTEEFITIVKKYARCFSEIGIKKRSRVGLCLPDSPEMIYSFIALSLLSACAVPVHPRLPAAHAFSLLQMCGADFIISDSAGAADFKETLGKNKYSCSLITFEETGAADYSINIMVERITAGDTAGEYPEIQPGEDDPLILLSSTGTSGTPKFVEITQRNVVNVIKATAYYMEPVEEFQKGYKTLCAFPLSTSALLTFTALFFLEITTILLDDFSPVRFLSLIEQWKIEVIAATPAYYESIIHLPVIQNYNTDSVKRFYSGMDFLSNKRLLKIKDCFHNTEIAGIGYGLTETSSVVMVWRAFNEKEFYIPTHCMTLIPGIGNEADIITPDGKKAETGEQGEIIIRGPNVVKEYYKNPLETKKAFHKGGWFYTGDMGCRDEKGRIHILGRMKDVIKRGGRSISPVVINNYILKHLGVHSSAVIGVPHSMFGEMIWAFVKKAEDEYITKGDLVRHCREGLPPYMIPDHISFIDAIPKKAGIGKIDNNELLSIALKELKKMTGG